MTRAELIDQMATLGSLAHKQADVVVETILEAMKGAISQGERVEIRGFGVFSLRLRRPRRARNPRTGEPLVSSERRAAHFKPGKEIKAILAGMDPGSEGGDAGDGEPEDDEA
jgi:integration host factor subunit beta